MKTIGLIGGITWLSTVEYYQLINQLVNQRAGGVSSAKLIVFSVDFSQIKTLTEAGDWESIAGIMGDAAEKLQTAGADCLLIGANTMHKIADSIQQRVRIPVIHIASVTADAIVEKGLRKVALLGTKYVMQMDFYTRKLAEKGIATLIPDEASVSYINQAIYTEFGKGIFLPETKKRFLEIIDSLIDAGAEGVIFGCTEIPILLKQEDCSLPVFDTTELHARAAVNYAMT
ncbi:MAG: aspartate/glutamate racemase family protein [Bacteroidota bacterium]|nr:aspartate/glutamate racemase family protein [Bacteroidota bacterium]